MTLPQSGWDQMTSISDLWNRAIHPVYDALGKNVGYYNSISELAAGRIIIYPGEQLPNYTQWRVKNDLGVVTPASTYLLGKGYRPFWMTETQAVQAKEDLPSPLQSILPDIHVPTIKDVLPDVNIPDLRLPEVSGFSLSKGNLALIGGLGLLALVILMRD